MSKQRPRTQRRIDERAARELVRTKEKLFKLETGGSRERPYEVSSAAVIEVRIEQLPCIQCEVAHYRINDHVSVEAGLRRLDIVCRNCGAPRSMWFRIVTTEPN